MRRVLILTAVLCQSVFGYASYSGWCENGGVKVTVQGLSSPLTFQQSFPNLLQSATGPNVTVYATGTTNKVTLYSDAAGTALNNPFPCSSSGQYQFFTVNSIVDLLFSGTGVSSFTRAAIAVTDGCPLNSACDASFPSLAVACTAAGTGTLYLTRTWSGLTTQTLACNIQALANGIIKPASGQTVTISGSFNGTMTQHIDTSAGGSVNFTGVVAAFYPQWFGSTVCNGTANDGPTFTAAIASMYTGSTIIVPSSNCLLTTGFTINKRITIQAGATSYPTSQFLAGADINMITLTGDGSNSTLSAFGLNANGHSGAKGIVMAGTISSPVTNVTIDHVIWNGNFLDALTGTYNYFAHYKDIRVFGAQTGFALGPQANSQDMTNVSFQDNQATVSNGINWTNSQMLAIHGLTMECGTIFSASNSYGASIVGGYGENSLSSGCAPMSTADGGSTNQAYVNFGTAFGGSPAYGNSVQGMLFNGAAAYGVKVGYGQGIQIDGNRFNTELMGVIFDIQPQASQVISAATNAATPVFTVAATPIGLEASQSVKISGFTGGWSSVNGTYVDTNVSATTFTAAGAPDTSGFGSIAGSPIAQFYAVTKDVHIGPNSYGAPLTQANAVGFTASNADTTATNVSSLMATPFIATYAMMAPQASHLKPGYGAMYWATTGGTSTTAGSWRGLWNNNGVSATTFPVTDLEASTTSVTDASYFNGSVILQPQGSTRATPAAGYSNFALRANSKNFYINQDDASGSQCGIANAACIDPNSTQPFVIKNLPASAGSGGVYLCIDSNNQIYRKSSCP